MKFMLLLLVALIGTLVGLSLADTRVLHNVKINVDDSTREETFSLNNENTSEEELVIKGTDRQIFPVGDGQHVYEVDTFYVADKDGYRVKYKLVRKESVLAGPVSRPFNLHSPVKYLITDKNAICLGALRSLCSRG